MKPNMTSKKDERDHLYNLHELVYIFLQGDTVKTVVPTSNKKVCSLSHGLWKRDFTGEIAKCNYFFALEHHKAMKVPSSSIIGIYSADIVLLCFIE